MRKTSLELEGAAAAGGCSPAVDGALALVADPLAAEAGGEVKERRPLSAWPATWERVFSADAGRGGAGGMRVF